MRFFVPLFLTSCALEIGDMNSSQNDKRILDPGQYGLLGQTLEVICDDTTGINKNPNTLIVPPISASEAGGTEVTRLIKTGRFLNAQNQLNPSIITLAIDATVTKLGTSDNEGEPQESLLQAVLRFSTGNGNQGTQSSTALTFANIELDPRIIIDLSHGTMLSFPAAQFQFDLLLTSVTTDSVGFTAGVPVGPNYNVTYSLGYEAQMHAGAVTMTQLHPERDLASGGSGKTFFSRPQYATSLYFSWLNWTDNTRNPLNVTFYNAQGNAIWNVSMYSNASVPPAVLPWPPDAVAVAVEQSSTHPFSWFRCTSYLEF